LVVSAGNYLRAGGAESEEISRRDDRDRTGAFEDFSTMVSLLLLNP
jgi:hypothetical protein